MIKKKRENNFFSFTIIKGNGRVGDGVHEKLPNTGLFGTPAPTSVITPDGLPPSKLAAEVPRHLQFLPQCRCVHGNSPTHIVSGIGRCLRPSERVMNPGVETIHFER